MKLKIVFDTRFSWRSQAEYWYNKAAAPFGVLFLFSGVLFDNLALAAIGGFLTAIGFLTELRFEEKP